MVRGRRVLCVRRELGTLISLYLSLAFAERNLVLA